METIRKFSYFVNEMIGGGFGRGNPLRPITDDEMVSKNPEPPKGWKSIQNLSENILEKYCPHSPDPESHYSGNYFDFHPVAARNVKTYLNQHLPEIKRFNEFLYLLNLDTLTEMFGSPFYWTMNYLRENEEYQWGLSGLWLDSDSDIRQYHDYEPFGEPDYAGASWLIDFEGCIVHIMRDKGGTYLYFDKSVDIDKTESILKKIIDIYLRNKDWGNLF